jgi:3-deoxy-7-phosphoheptulonate synthase
MEKEIMIFAGPCAIESYSQAESVAKLIKEQGVDYMRGGIMKYRSDPETYQGNVDAVNWMIDIKFKHNIKYVVEVFNESEIEEYSVLADMYQVGSRNMHNTPLLKALNKTKRPVILKRHYSASLQEFVKHSDYLKDCDVHMCLRGILSLWPQEQRFQPDISDIQRLRELTDNKILYDVSHSSCHVDYVINNTLAALQYKPDGLMVEVHPNPSKALSDAQQQLDFEQFRELMEAIR